MASEQLFKISVYIYGHVLFVYISYEISEQNTQPYTKRLSASPLLAEVVSLPNN